jgi:hypothetical protein
MPYQNRPILPEGKGKGWWGRWGRCS